MVLGVEDLVRNTVLLQFIRQVLGLLHAGCSDQDRLTRRVPFDNVFDDRVELRTRRSVHQIRLVHADHRTIRRNGDDSEVVDLIELRCFCHRGSGHARQLVVEAEEVLQRHGGEGLILCLDLDAFFGLDRLVQALVVATPLENATGVLVDDDDSAIKQHVITILLEQLFRSNRIVEEAHKRGVDRVIEVVDTKLVLDFVDCFLQNADRALLLVNLVVLISLENLYDASELRVPRCRLVSRTANDQRCSGLINEDRVHFVNNGKIVASLNHLGFGPRHIVAEVVEPELVVGPIRDVRGVRGAALRRAHLADDDAHF